MGPTRWELETQENMLNLARMTGFFDKMTKFPRHELITIAVRHVPPANDSGGIAGYERRCLLFPYVEGIAQAYDWKTGNALHVKRVPGDDTYVVPLYTPSQRLRVVAPFVEAWPITFAFTREGNIGVVINREGKILWDSIPVPLKSMMMQ